MAERIRRAVLVDQIAASIREDILKGNLRPGERIHVASLARDLGVSHIPVREAIRRLEAEALVLTIPHHSTIVADMRVEELHEIYDLRRIIEADTIQKAAVAYTDDDIAAIEKAWTRLKSADPRDLTGDFWRAHHDFHWAMLEPGMDPWRRRILGQLWQSAERYHRMFTLVFGSLADAQAEHSKLSESARNKSPKQMASILTGHLNHTENTVVAGYVKSQEGGATAEQERPDSRPPSTTHE